jgi:HTH-type transcriptional regulator / antitoxin HipB
MADHSNSNTVGIPSAAVLGRHIRAARLKKGLTQRDLAKQLFCSLRWITEVENGKDTAQIGKILGLCQFLDLQVRLALPSQGNAQSENGAQPESGDYPDLKSIMGGNS